ncbi:MAG: hypothetical protein R3301_19980 [Saprospiraceae bacterium]|nr:hypothetical protein [Saprospiraceae bacterium]
MQIIRSAALLIGMLVAAQSVHAQAWFDLGFKFGVGPTIMYNKNIFDDRDYDHVLTSGTAIGGKLGVNFADHHAFTFDYLSSKSKQNFEYSDGVVNNLRNEFAWDHSDILIMYRYSGYGAFIELGPKFSSVKEVRQSFLGAPEGDVSNLFEDNYKSVVFGFGSYLMGSDLLTVQVGVRLHYALDDFISPEGQALNFPTVATAYQEYRETRATAVQFGVEINYAFGRFARAACSHRWKLILFE